MQKFSSSYLFRHCGWIEQATHVNLFGAFSGVTLLDLISFSYTKLRTFLLRPFVEHFISTSRKIWMESIEFLMENFVRWGWYTWSYRSSVIQRDMDRLLWHPMLEWCGHYIYSFFGLRCGIISNYSFISSNDIAPSESSYYFSTAWIQIKHIQAWTFRAEDPYHIKTHLP